MTLFSKFKSSNLVDSERVSVVEELLFLTKWDLIAASNDLVCNKILKNISEKHLGLFY